MLSMIARKNIMLNQKMEILSKRTTREKLLAFFNTQVQMNHSKKFSIPYNREGLAFYLCVDRSALSRELSNMRDEGLLKFNKNEFEIL
jgi:CRP-like cAMP-binding protein